MGFNLIALSLNFSALCAVIACLVISALLYSDWSARRRARKWIGVSRNGRPAPSSPVDSSRRFRMTAGLVAAGAICAVAAAKFVQNDVVEVEAKTPQQIEPETSATSISDISGANSAFDAITLDLSGSDSSEEDDVELVLNFSETNESLVEGLTESSGGNRFPGAARADLEWLRRSGATVPSAPRNSGVVTESAVEWYPAAR